MSEIKPVYQVQQLGEWIEVDKSIFDELYIQNKFPHRILYPAAAYEALQKENAELKRIQSTDAIDFWNLTEQNAAQAKRIGELYDVANGHRNAYIAASKALDSQKSEIESLRKQVEDLTDILVCVTHHDGALQEYKPRWISIVQDELSRRRSLSASKNGE